MEDRHDLGEPTQLFFNARRVRIRRFHEPFPVAIQRIKPRRLLLVLEMRKQRDNY